MGILASLPFTFFADAAAASAASSSMRSYVMPLVSTIIAIASIAVVFFLVNGGIQYMTSSGNPEKLEHAKKVIRNALIGLAIVIGAATLTGILAHAYGSPRTAPTSNLPSIVTIEAPGTGVVDVLISSITGLINKIIQTLASPFINALEEFTKATPLMADNAGVFNLWLTTTAIADVLFIVVVALLGFRVMSFATFGFEEIELKHMLPQIGLVFLLVNTSIFAIDAVIELSNAMITALHAGTPPISVWKVLTMVSDLSGGMNIGALLIMLVFVVLAVMLLIYYIMRLVVLYIGAVLAPIVFLLWLIPSFKEFAVSAIRQYLMTILVLFVHCVILALAATLFAGMMISTPGQIANPIMSMVLGVATLLCLLKTQSVMSQMSYAGIGPRTAAKLGGQFVNAVSHFSNKSSRSSSGSNNTNGLMPKGAAAMEMNKNRGKIFNQSGSTTVNDRPRLTNGTSAKATTAVRGQRLATGSTKEFSAMQAPAPTARPTKEELVKPRKDDKKK